MRNRTDTDSFARLQSKKGRSAREIHSSSSQRFPTTVVTMLSLAFFFLSPLFNSGTLSAQTNGTATETIGVYVSPPGVMEFDLVAPNYEVKEYKPYVEGFNSFSAPNNDWAPGGYHSESIGGTYLQAGGISSIVPDDQYGSGTGNYLTIGSETEGYVQLSLDDDVRYFGFAWSAGNDGNTIQILSDGEVLFTMDTDDVMALLPQGAEVTAVNGTTYNTSEYYGKPPAQTQNTNEPYAFIHFVASEGLSFDEVRLTHVGNGAFENDNHTILRGTPPNPEDPEEDIPWVEVYIKYPPVAEDDESLDNPFGTPVTVDVLDNDEPGHLLDENDNEDEFDLVPETVVITGITEEELEPELSEDGKELVVPGEGTWTVDPDGSITFTPEQGFTGDPTPITYRVSDTGDLASNNAIVTITYVDPVSVVLTEDECWRLLSSPQEGQTYAGLLEGLWTQGGTGASHPAGEPNIFIWDTGFTGNEAGGWVPVTDLTAVIPAGTGFLISVFTDDEYGTPGTWPKTLTVTGPEHSGPVTPTPLNQTEYGWTLLGNPFQSPIAFSELATENMAGVAYIYDRNLPGWRTTTDDEYGDIEDGIISPFQGFFMHNDGTANAPSVVFTDAIKTEGGQFYGKQQSERKNFVRLEVNGGEVSGSMWVRFTDNGSEGLFANDALKLDPMAEKYALLAARKSDGTLVENGHYPLPGSDNGLSIPVHLTTTHGGTYTLTATDLDIPAGSELYFEDLHTGQKMPITSSFEYTFTTDGQVDNDQFKATPESGLVPCAAAPRMAKSSGRDRFLITASAPNGTEHNQGELPTETSLQQNYPNPFNPSTIIRYNLAAESDVQLDVFDTLGRRVATLVEGTKSAGAHTVNFDASGLNSGIYFYRLRAQNQVFSKQMILVK